MPANAQKYLVTVEVWYDSERETSEGEMYHLVDADGEIEIDVLAPTINQAWHRAEDIAEQLTGSDHVNSRKARRAPEDHDK